MAIKVSLRSSGLAARISSSRSLGGPKGPQWPLWPLEPMCQGQDYRGELGQNKEIRAADFALL